MWTMPGVLAFLLAAGCAAAMGFAIQRGATCAVVAAEEVLSEGRVTRLAAMAEAALWVAGGLFLARALGLLTAVPAGSLCAHRLDSPGRRAAGAWSLRERCLCLRLGGAAGPRGVGLPRDAGGLLPRLPDLRAGHRGWRLHRYRRVRRCCRPRPPSRCRSGRSFSGAWRAPCSPRVRPASACATWDAVLAVNLTAPTLLAQEAMRFWQAQRGGAIVNIGSRTWLSGAGPGYTASKAGLVGLTRSLAVQLGPLGITVNAVAPSYLGSAFNFPGNEEARRRAEQEHIRLGVLDRLGTAEDVAGAVAFLTSEDARFITGEVIHVCGGAQLAARPASAEITEGTS